MDRVQSETKAGVTVAKLRTQQNAAKDYLASQERARTEGYKDYVSYFPGDKYPQSSSSDDSASGSSWPIEDYVPFGHQLPATAEGVITKVFCMDDNTATMSDEIIEDYADQCDMSAEPTRSCCSDSSGIFVVTFQTITARWLNKSLKTPTPSTDLIGALQRIPGYGNSIGYIIHNDDGDILSGGRAVNTYDFNVLDATGQPKIKSTIHEFRKIYTAIQSDKDYKYHCGKDNGKTCIFAIQQIYS
jgi:hypothetical protein